MSSAISTLKTRLKCSGLILQTYVLCSGHLLVHLWSEKTVLRGLQTKFRRIVEITHEENLELSL